jgi:hypothetical protein
MINIARIMLDVTKISLAQPRTAPMTAKRKMKM